MSVATLGTRFVSVDWGQALYLLPHWEQALSVATPGTSFVSAATLGTCFVSVDWGQALCLLTGDKLCVCCHTADMLCVC